MESWAKRTSRRLSQNIERRNLHYTITEYLLDLVQNSIEAGSRTIELNIDERKTTDEATITVTLSDDGKGMDGPTVQRALDPFFTDGEKHPGRSVGLGLPFVRQMVDAVDGTFEITSEPGKGTRIGLSFPADHIDAPPLGEIAEMVSRLCCFDGDYELTVHRRRNDSGYTLRRSELRDALGELETVGSQSLLAEYIGSQEESLEITEGGRVWQR